MKILGNNWEELIDFFYKAFITVTSMVFTGGRTYRVFSAIKLLILKESIIFKYLEMFDDLYKSIICFQREKNF